MAFKHWPLVRDLRFAQKCGRYLRGARKRRPDLNWDEFHRVALAIVETDRLHPATAEQCVLAARAYGLGGRKEIAFALAPDAPPLASDAPGSAGLRVGAAASRVSPLDRWLTLLFGPGD